MDDIKVVIGSSGTVNVGIKNEGERLPYYDGDHTVTPIVANDITLATANRSMRENITVNKIPSYSVENPSGGNTFIIGG